jgi:formylglycine-generating enzyme required for sulfatase activity
LGKKTEIRNHRSPSYPTMTHSTTCLRAKIAVLGITILSVGSATIAAEDVSMKQSPHLIPDIKLTLQPIPAGTFKMGSPANELGRKENEGPQRETNIARPFWFGKTEITLGQWRAVMGTDIVDQAKMVLADNTVYNSGGKSQTLRQHYRAQADSDPRTLVDNTDDDFPVYWINWHDAVAFCRRLSERERSAGRLPSGYVFRLPTEAEWEYACRAGTTEATYAGNLNITETESGPRARVLDPIAWYGNTGTSVPHKVGELKPNAFGLHDMLGNVMEWCADAADHKLSRELDNPQRTPPDLRVARGGSTGTGAEMCRAARRFMFPATMRSRRAGFRIALGPILE